MTTKAVPLKIKGTEFERIVQVRLDKYKVAGIADIRRSGVQATMKPDMTWQVIPSRPDFEGVFAGPVPVCFDCKVCSGASMDLSPYRDDTKGARRRQLNYMFDKARYDVRCFFLVHWNARALKTKEESSETYAMPVHREQEFWVQFLAGDVRSLTRSDCVNHGVLVPWTLFSSLDRSFQPDIRAVL